MTASGIEPATCRFVAQCLNHYATARHFQMYCFKFFNPLRNEFQKESTDFVASASEKASFILTFAFFESFCE
jgi:hypothetical protein